MRIIFVLLLFFIKQLRADDEQDEWRHPENCSGYGCDYRAQWRYLEKTDEIKFMISTKFRNKWTGIGFSDGQQMKGTDAVIGLVEDNGRYFLMDTYLGGYQAPPLDAVQNIHNMTVWRENGVTHLQFHRYRTTSDPEYDFQFTDDHCAYFHFPIKGGVFNAVNKRMRKHEEIPIVSKNRICIRSKDYNKRKKVIEVPPAVRFNVPNKPKIPNRFKARPKLTNLNHHTTSTTTTTTTTTSTTTAPTNAIQFKSPELTTSNHRVIVERKPIDQLTTIPVDLNNLKEKSLDKIIDKSNSNEQTTIRPTTLDGRIYNTNSSTISVVVSTSTAASIELSTSVSSANDYSKSSNQNVNLNANLNSIEATRSSEPKNEEKLEYGDGEDEEATSENKKTTTENLPSLDHEKAASSDQTTTNDDGRISTAAVADQADEQASASGRNSIKSFSFELKIVDKETAELNSTVVRQEAEKEFSDLTGFKQLKLITLKPAQSDPQQHHHHSKKDDKAIWIADFEMQVKTEPDTNETEYLAYLQSSLNETVISGHIGNLMLDTSHYAHLKGF